MLNISRLRKYLAHKRIIIILTPLLLSLAGCNQYTVKINKPDKVWDSYTVPSSALGGPTAVIDMNGNVVKQFNCPGYPVKMLPDGSIMCDNLVVASLTVPELRQVGPDGQILWRFRNWRHHSANQHHDYEVGGDNPVGYYAPGLSMIGPADGGNVLILAHQFYGMGQQNIHLGVLQDDTIYEIDPAGNILWQWHAKDHIDEMGFSKSARKAIYFDLLADWLHTNSLSYVGPNKWYEEDHDERFNPHNIIIGSPRGRWIAIIDKDTGHFVWRLGPDYSPGHPGADFGGVAFAHLPHIIPKGLPGAGNLLVFDNGTFSGFGDQHTAGRGYSRVLEINPIDYSVVWEYHGDLLSLNMGSAQRLPNGNTFITEALRGRMIEVTPDKEVVWEAVGQPLYRAYRVPKSWVKPDKS